MSKQVNKNQSPSVQSDACLVTSRNQAAASCHMVMATAEAEQQQLGVNLRICFTVKFSALKHNGNPFHM